MGTKIFRRGLAGNRQLRIRGELTMLMVYYFNTKNQYVDDNEREIKLGIKIGGFLRPEY